MLMTDYLIIKKINEIVEKYFTDNPEVNSVRAKDLMPWFMKGGIYQSNEKDALPLRDDLRKWDGENRLKALKYLLVDRKVVNRNWWFVRPEQPTEANGMEAFSVSAENSWEQGENKVDGNQ